jgi:hypothetical protein
MWNQKDFCDPDTGIDYVFTKMNGIFGAAFQTNWKNVDADMVRQVWKEVCGIGLTYRPKMDYALAYMNPERPPSALAFAKLLNEGPRIPDKPHSQIERQKTQAELAEEKRRGDEARAKLQEFLREFRKPKNASSSQNGQEPG